MKRISASYEIHQSEMKEVGNLLEENGFSYNIIDNVRGAIIDKSIERYIGSVQSILSSTGERFQFTIELIDWTPNAERLDEIMRKTCKDFTQRVVSQ